LVFGKAAESRGLSEELGRLFIQDLGLLYRGPFCCLSWLKKIHTSGSCQKALLLIVAMASTEWANGWMNAVVPYTLESPVQILP